MRPPGELREREGKMGLIFEKGQKVLFVGDSITDCGRRELGLGLGVGYVRDIGGILGARHPELGLELVNMGVSGDTVRELAGRWERDVIEQRPDWVSVAIGINDVWRQVRGESSGVSVEEFEATYQRLLERTRETVRSRFILMETTVIREALEDGANEMLKPYNRAIRKLAKESGAVLVPMNREWHRAIRGNPGVKWTTDGVHPGVAGHGLMARVWLNAVGFKW